MWLLLEILFRIAGKTRPKIFCFAAVEFTSCPHHAKLLCFLLLDPSSLFVSFFYFFEGNLVSHAQIPVSHQTGCCCPVACGMTTGELLGVR